MKYIGQICSHVERGAAELKQPACLTDIFQYLVKTVSYKMFVILDTSFFEGL